MERKERKEGRIRSHRGTEATQGEGKSAILCSRLRIQPVTMFVVLGEQFSFLRMFKSRLTVNT